MHMLGAVNVTLSSCTDNWVWGISQLCSLLLGFAVLQVAKKKGGRGRGQAAQMYGKEVILKCDSAVAVVVDLHDQLQRCREVCACAFCVGGLGTNGDTPQQYERNNIKKKKDKSMHVSIWLMPLSAWDRSLWTIHYVFASYVTQIKHRRQSKVMGHTGVILVHIIEKKSHFSKSKH